MTSTVSQLPGATEQPADPAEAEAADLHMGKALRFLREGVGITQTEVARRGGPDFRTISHWETGRKMPTLRLLFRYLAALQLDLNDLQAAFDQITKRPDGLASRFTVVEQRLTALERWRLEMTAAAMDSGQE